MNVDCIASISEDGKGLWLSPQVTHALHSEGPQMKPCFFQVGLGTNLVCYTRELLPDSFDSIGQNGTTV